MDCFSKILIVEDLKNNCGRNHCFGISRKYSCDSKHQGLSLKERISLIKESVPGPVYFTIKIYNPQRLTDKILIYFKKKIVLQNSRLYVVSSHPKKKIQSLCTRK